MLQHGWTALYSLNTFTLYRLLITYEKIKLVEDLALPLEFSLISYVFHETFLEAVYLSWEAVVY